MARRERLHRPDHIYPIDEWRLVEKQFFPDYLITHCGDSVSLCPGEAERAGDRSRGEVRYCLGSARERPAASDVRTG